MPATEFQPGCRFCSIADGGGALAEYDRPIATSERYFALPSLGGFLSGWTLICPRHHRVNLSAEYAVPAFLDFARRTYAAVTAEFGPAVTFEHGAAREGSVTGCGTDHAHLHFVPFAESLVTLVRRHEPTWNWIACSISDIRVIAAGREYLFMSDQFEHSGMQGYLHVLTEPRSQFFRHAIAEHMGLGRIADYRHEPFEAKAVTTGMRLRERLRDAKYVAA